MDDILIDEWMVIYFKVVMNIYNIISDMIFFFFMILCIFVIDIVLIICGLVGFWFLVSWFFIEEIGDFKSIVVLCDFCIYLFLRFDVLILYINRV